MKQFTRLTVKVQAHFMKTLNSSSGKNTYLMRGVEVPYKFRGKTDVKVSNFPEFITENKERILDDIKELTTKAKGKKPDSKIKISILKDTHGISRVVKGIRGALRHSILNILYEKGISYCSPTQKKQFQTGESTLLDGEHLMDSCKDNPCPISRLFGTINKKSPIRVWSDLLVQAKEHLDLSNIISQKGITFVHISTENRHQARRDKKALQDFFEQHFSGEFQFYIEFSEELPEWLLGLLDQGILNLTTIGRGSNSGYGRFTINSVLCEQVLFERKLGAETNGRIAINEVEKTTNQNHKLQEWVNSWEKHKPN
jgi:hypothetical protein